jgi:malonyl-CoA decarboxylase
MMADDSESRKKKSLADIGQKTLDDLGRTWDRFVGLTRRKVTGRVDPDLSSTDETFLKQKIHDCVYGRGGDMASRAESVELGEIYLGLSPKGRQKFIAILARDFDVDREHLERVRRKIQDAPDEMRKAKAEIELSAAMVPPRVKLLKQFNSLPDGFKFLIDFRSELLAYKKQDPFLGKLDADLKNILSSWFDIGFLDLSEITWDSPASLLEKLIQYEAVHEIRSWTDLKNRLESDRQCFAFFHSKVPAEPLIFVEVALVNSVSANIQELLDPGAETVPQEKVDTAIFYSISNTQKGLAGINLGNFLIKQVVDRLRIKLKNLKHFATLSPLPGFRKWLDVKLLDGDESLLNKGRIESLRQKTGNQNAARGLLQWLNSSWVKSEQKVSLLKAELMPLAARYLLKEKRGKKVLDPVANFHLSNGARIERLNWMGNTSERGLKESAGLMVNYYYKLSDIEKNHERYSTRSLITASKEIKKWL